ncbi:PEPL1 aminopeptidase, partial [Polypterus senegalus]
MSRELHLRDCYVAESSPREAVSGEAAVVIGLNMANVTLEFRESIGDSDPLTRPVLILGQLSNLQRVSWSQLQGKLQPSVNQEGRCGRCHRVTNPIASQMVCERSEVFASACAIARAFPLFTRRSSASRRADKRVVVVEFIVVGQDNGPLEVSVVEEIKVVGSELGIVPTIIRGEELKERGFGGIYGVGKAAEHPPALAVLSHLPDGATQTIAWVGKGIVYDTGGLSIKGKGFKDNLHAVFCLAENAVGPNATRPDDIHILYSGKSVEINNTDAEGRLVLSDGVAYASKDLGADIILDMATLTGAQGISTGKYHAAVVTNSETWETACAKAGRSSGDLIHPLVYCPELHFSEFTSAVADMKNSVADRENAQSSCAALFIASHIGFDWPGVWVHVDIASPVHADRENAQSSCAALFIASHIGFDWPGVWVHVDIASPVHAGERATGYGVALLLALFGRASEDPLLNLVSPLGLETSMECDEVERDSKRRRLV